MTDSTKQVDSYIVKSALRYAIQDRRSFLGIIPDGCGKDSEISEAKQLISAWETLLNNYEENQCQTLK